MRLVAFLLFLLLSSNCFAQCAVTNANPAFVGGGNLWGRTSAQVNQYFGLKADANNSILCNPTVQQLLILPDGGQATPAGIANTSINNSPIGNTTPSTGVFTTLTVNGKAITGHGLLAIQTFCNTGCTSTTGTYTPTSGTNLVVVDIQAPGGSSGGCAATGAGQVCATAGASGGSFVEFLLTSGFSGVTVTSPAGPAGAAAGNNSGTTGSTASFGSIMSCPGGINSPGSAAITAPTTWTMIASPVSATPACSIGTGSPQVIYSIQGAMGAYAVAAGSGANQQQSGAGGASVLGTFSQGLFTTAANSGSPGTGYGKGGNGAVLVPSQAAQGGGAGAQGIVIIREYN